MSIELASIEPGTVRDVAAPYVTIILPCYNEEGHVIAEVERICAAMDASGYSYELLAIDDASTDGTLGRLYEAQPHFPQMEVVAAATAARAWCGGRAPSAPAVRLWCGPTPT